MDSRACCPQSHCTWRHAMLFWGKQYAAVVNLLPLLVSHGMDYLHMQEDKQDPGQGLTCRECWWSGCSAPQRCRSWWLWAGLSESQQPCCWCSGRCSCQHRWKECSHANLLPGWSLAARPPGNCLSPAWWIENFNCTQSEQIEEWTSILLKVNKLRNSSDLSLHPIYQRQNCSAEEGTIWSVAATLLDSQCFIAAKLIMLNIQCTPKSPITCITKNNAKNNDWDKRGFIPVIYW